MGLHLCCRNLRQAGAAGEHADLDNSATASLLKIAYTFVFEAAAPVSAFNESPCRQQHQLILRM